MGRRAEPFAVANWRHYMPQPTRSIAVDDPQGSSLQFRPWLTVTGEIGKVRFRGRNG